VHRDHSEMLTAAATTSSSVVDMGHCGDTPDYDYGDAPPDRRDDDAQPDADMGYGDAKPDLRLHHDRRSSMSDAQQQN